PDWRTFARDHAGEQLSLDGLDFAPVVPAPEKIICVGLNYRAHILEMGRELPEFPTLFAKYPRALVGAFDDIVLPPASDAVDWEAELGVVVGTEVRHADADQAAAAIAGYTVVNDVTERDWQYRTTQWMQGKNFERTTPMGPYLVTGDAGAGIAAFELSCELDGEVVQRANTADLVFDPVALVAYVSTMVTLVPGDVIATGTPGGVGHARKPARYLTDGAVLTTRIDGVGECRNTCRADK
ncbi:MAG TPA: fumarylacetoacetate hydrolase family protein, partial [Candidatus Limnocylindria bacterium]|nr:fumarylacetoacetate hydrolase family protein [Candidatus Limnocylindria bacterium]